MNKAWTARMQRAMEAADREWGYESPPVMVARAAAEEAVKVKITPEVVETARRKMMDRSGGYLAAIHADALIRAALETLGFEVTP